MFKSVGDRNLYEGIDSALKATFFWTFTDNQSGADYMSLYVPLLLLADPFWDVCIDGGSVGDVELRRRGYHSCRYPIGSLQVSEVTTSVWSAEERPALLTSLDGLLRWFKSNARSYMPTR